MVVGLLSTLEKVLVKSWSSNLQLTSNMDFIVKPIGKERRKYDIDVSSVPILAHLPYPQDFV